MVEVSIIALGSTYVTFYIAEELEISGVIAVICLSLYISKGKRRMSPQVEEYLANFYQMMGYVANTVVFSFSGLKAFSNSRFEWSSFLLLIFLYIMIHVIRAMTTIPIAFGFSYRSKEPFPLQKVLIFICGGMRGSVTLTLALFVDSAFGGDIGGRLLFYITGIVILTQFVNQAVLKWLIHRFDVSTISHARKEILHESVMNLKSSADANIVKLQEDKFLADTDWDIVREYIYYPVLPPEEEFSESVSEVVEAKDEYIATTVRERFLTAEHQQYRSMFENGTLTRVAFNFLSDRLDLATENHFRMLTMNDFRKVLEPPSNFLRRMARFPLIGRFFQKAVYREYIFAYQVSLAYINAQEMVRRMIQKRADEEEGKIKEKSKERGYRPSRERQKFIFASEHAKEIMRTSNANAELVLRQLLLLHETQPEVTASVKTSFSIKRILDQQIIDIQAMKKKGLIDKDEEDRLEEIIMLRQKRLHFDPPFTGPPSLSKFLHESPWIEDLDYSVQHSVVQAMLKMAMTRQFKEGDYLIRAGDASNSNLFVVLKGVVQIAKDGQALDMGGIGSIYGELSFLTGKPRYADFIAETDLTVAELPSSQMKTMLANHPEASTSLWSRSSRRLGELILKADPNPRFSKKAILDLREWMNDCTYYEPDDPKEKLTIEVKHWALVLHGVFRTTASLKGNVKSSVKSKDLWTQPTKAPMLVRGPEKLQNINDAKILILNKPIPAREDEPEEEDEEAAEVKKRVEGDAANNNTIGKLRTFQRINDAANGGKSKNDSSKSMMNLPNQP
jgi:hypothetical protein